MGIDPLGLATASERSAAVAVLKCMYPSEFAKDPTSVSMSPMGEGSQGYTDWGNNISLNSDTYGDNNTPVNPDLQSTMLQTLAHEMLHVNQGFFSRIVSNAFRMSNPLGYFHRKLDEHADDLVTVKLLGEYRAALARGQAYCMCSK